MQYKCEDAHIAHIDDQLDFTNIYPLIVYTESEAQKEKFKDHFESGVQLIVK